ncbi:RECA1 [Auxenochlorella protothecoides x Auxenochlorella symbiontica]
MQRCAQRLAHQASRFSAPVIRGRSLSRESFLVSNPYDGARSFTTPTLVCHARATKEKGSVPVDSADAKASALDHVMKEINSRFGKNSIMLLGDNKFGEVRTTPSGALTLDIALGGGYPVGRIVEILGPEASGKTTLALHAMAEVQKRGGAVALIDAEHAFDPLFAKRLGLDIGRLFLCQPDSGEMALEVADSLMRSGAVDMVAVDSVAALVPRAELEGEIGQTQIGSQARLMSSALRKIAGNASRHACTLLFINQIRHKVGVIFGSPETTSGGMALKYYASVRLEVRPKEKIMADGEQAGIKIKAKCTKNKVAPPYRIAEFDIMFGSGINGAGCVLDAAEKVGVVIRRGAYYYLGEERLGQGREKTLETLAERPELLSHLEEETRQVLTKGGHAVGDAFGEASSSEEEPEFLSEADEGEAEAGGLDAEAVQP